MRRSVLAVLALLLAALGGACRMLPARQPECRSEIAVLSAQPEQLRRRAHYERRSSGGTVSFELVIEKQGARLVVLGLSPFGAKAFAIQQEGETLEIDRFLGPALEIEPRDVLRDLGHAAYLEATRPAKRVRVENRSCGYETLITLASD